MLRAMRDRRARTSQGACLGGHAWRDLVVRRLVRQECSSSALVHGHRGVAWRGMGAVRPGTAVAARAVALPRVVAGSSTDEADRSDAPHRGLVEATGAVLRTTSGASSSCVRNCRAVRPGRRAPQRRRLGRCERPRGRAHGSRRRGAAGRTGPCGSCRSCRGELSRVPAPASMPAAPPPPRDGFRPVQNPSSPRNSVSSPSSSRACRTTRRAMPSG